MAAEIADLAAGVCHNNGDLLTDRILVRAEPASGARRCGIAARRQIGEHGGRSGPRVRKRIWWCLRAGHPRVPGREQVGRVRIPDLEAIEIEISVVTSASAERLAALEEVWRERCPIYLAIVKANQLSVRLAQAEPARVT